MSSAIIEWEDICLVYGRKKIFDHFNLTIEQGQKVLISGKSGNGKSSLLKLLLGFRDYDQGQIRFKGRVITDRDFLALRKNFAYVNQAATIRHGKVQDILQRIAGFKHNQFNGRLDSDLLAYFDLDQGLLEKQVEDLSGGERQRLAILIAIHLEREVYLLDEVTAGLDAETKIKVIDFFATCEQTVLCVSHDREWQQDERFRQVVIRE